jgi:hypothetical protein
VAAARQVDARLVGEGRYADMLAAWRKVAPGPGEDAAEVRAVKQRRIAELEVKLALSREAARAVAAGADPREPAEEKRLARILHRAPPNHPPPFDQLAGYLQGWAKRRQAATAAAARRRFEEARARVSPEAGEWRRRTELAQSARPLFGVQLDGRSVDGVRLVSLGPKQFTVRTGEGERTFAWERAPRLGVQVFAAVAERSNRADQRELLALALLARDPLVAAWGATWPWRRSSRPPPPLPRWSR